MGDGRLLISLDFELHWGIRDHTPVERCAERLLGVRRAIPAMLDLFRSYDVRATWATVGMLFARDRDELEAFLPPVRPTYRDERLSAYPALGEVGRNEEDDPYHFAPSLVALVAETPGQEIGTHTFSHYYTLEAGQTVAQYVADLRAALALAERHGIRPSSIVFPRNQYAREHLEPLAELGIRAYRGAAPGWSTRPRSGTDERAVRRGLRLLDAYLPVSGRGGVRSAAEPGLAGLVNVPASRFLRPYHPRLRQLDALRIRRIRREIRHAAREGLEVHLWWHPHNFGAHLQENLDALRRVLDAFAAARERYGMRSVTMSERAAEVLDGG